MLINIKSNISTERDFLMFKNFKKLPEDILLLY